MSYSLAFPLLDSANRQTNLRNCKHNCSHTQQPNLMLLQGSLDTLVFFFLSKTKPPRLTEDAWEMCKPPPWEESSAVIARHQKLPSPLLSQPSLGHQISSSSLAGVLQHHRFLPQPSLPLEFLQVEISLLPQPFAGRFPPVFTVEPTRKEEVTYLSPEKHCLPFSRRL